MSSGAFSSPAEIWNLHKFSSQSVKNLPRSLHASPPTTRVLPAGYRAEPSAVDGPVGVERRTRARKRGHSMSGLLGLTRILFEVERETNNPVS